MSSSRAKRSWNYHAALGGSGDPDIGMASRMVYFRVASQRASVRVSRPAAALVWLTSLYVTFAGHTSLCVTFS
jgi:hypothetical protein